MKLLYVLGGLICVGLGGIGAVVPGMPATVFFIMAAWMFSKSSPRLEQWVLNLPGVGQMVTDYRNGLGMPKKAKIMAITMLTIAVAVSTGLAIEIAWVRVLVLALGAVGVYWISIRVPTKHPEPNLLV